MELTTDPIVYVFLSVLCAAVAIANFYIHSRLIEKVTLDENYGITYGFSAMIAYCFNWNAVCLLITIGSISTIAYYADGNFDWCEWSKMSLVIFIINIILTWAVYTIKNTIENMIRMYRSIRALFKPSN